jgi:hypothetical protein
MAGDDNKGNKKNKKPMTEEEKAKKAEYERKYRANLTP